MKFFRARIPRGKTPGAGQRVNLERRGQQGEQEIDALPGDLQSSFGFTRTARAFAPHQFLILIA
jgi:hypothetical protein